MIKTRDKKWAAAQKRWAEKVKAQRLEDGCKVWNRLGRGKSRRERHFAIIREIVETRADELRRAYPDLLAVGAGMGTTEGEDSKTPCLMFLVAKKKKQVPAEKELPSHLFTYVESRGKHVLCAVPTDVEEQHAYRSVKAHLAQQIHVSSGSSGAIRGVLTTPIRIRFDGTLDNQVYVLSCVHVLGMAQQFFPSLGPNCKFRPRGTNTPIGKLSSYIGRLVSADNGYSFDAALGVVDDDEAALAALRALLPEPWPTSRISGVDDVPLEAKILTGRGEIPAVRRTQWMRDSVLLQYEAPGGFVEILHSDLVEWDADTERGDSGSPVVAKHDPDLLLGMHIAGDERGTAFMIPAYELFNPVRLHLGENDSMRIPTTI